MSLITVAYAQWPEGLTPDSPQWQQIAEQVRAAEADLLITNEMPFGPWLAEHATFDAQAAQHSVALHESALGALARLDVPAVLSSRPLLADGRLVNEAFVLDATGYRFVHQKHFFPEEPGFHEQTWFTTVEPGFDVIEVGKLKLGVLLCTELMFNERARHYGRDGADLIAVPRASGTDYRYWDCAAAMAAIVSGAYVISANRTGQAEQGQRFGGHGTAYSPSGQPLAVAAKADDHALLQVVRIDLEQARRQKYEYPCYLQNVD